MNRIHITLVAVIVLIFSLTGCAGRKKPKHNMDKAMKEFNSASGKIEKAQKRDKKNLEKFMKKTKDSSSSW